MTCVMKSTYIWVDLPSSVPNVRFLCGKWKEVTVQIEGVTWFVVMKTESWVSCCTAMNRS